MCEGGLKGRESIKVGEQGGSCRTENVVQPLPTVTINSRVYRALAHPAVHVSKHEIYHSGTFENSPPNGGYNQKLIVTQFPSIVQVTKAADVAIHSDVVEVVLCCLYLNRIDLRNVLLSKDGTLTKLGTVVKVYLSIKTHHWW